MLSFDRTEWGLILALPLLILIGFIVPQWVVNYIQVSLGGGLVALAVMIQMRAGLVSFGQGLYFCIGGYTAGIVSKMFGIPDFFIMTSSAIIIGGAISFILGFLLRRYRHIFYAMLSLAVSMVLFGLLSRTEDLGSTDGFNLPAVTFLTWKPEGDNAGDILFVATCSITIACAFFLHRYLRSPMGYINEALRENEIRVEYLGASPKQAVHIVYILAAIASSTGGALWAMALGHVDPEMTNWTTSGQFVFISILSGTGSVIAPLIGTFILEIIRVYAVEISPHSWQIIVGTAMLLIILFLPKGIGSLFGSVIGQRLSPAHAVKSAINPQDKQSPPTQISQDGKSS